MSICSECGMPIRGDQSSHGGSHMHPEDCITALRADLARVTEERDKTWRGGNCAGPTCFCAEAQAEVERLTAALAAERERVRAEVLAAVEPLFEEEGCGCDPEEPVLSNRHQCFAGRMEWALRMALTPTTEAWDAKGGDHA